nr:RNA-directed DNA polymerase, eukaryota [Tanacetum cinerariifolium]
MFAFPLVPLMEEVLAQICVTCNRYDVDLFNIKSCWVNLNFDSVVSPLVGNSGDILCVWDPIMFHKENFAVSNYFLAIIGKWLPNNKNLLIISVYTPQELAEKKMLWKYLNHVIDRWNGNVNVMGDFNKVHTMDEKFGSIFNAHGAAAFNSFYFCRWFSGGSLWRPSHEGYSNTIELPKGNNIVPLSDTIWLVQNGCSFHGLRFEDPNQHLKDFLKLVDSLDLDVANRERKRLHLFQFSLRDQARNWLEHLPAGFISTWEDLTTRFLA